MADFSKAFEVVMHSEGGYADDPADRGGETYKGVSRVYHPTWGGWFVVDHIKAVYPLDFRNKFISNSSLQELVRDFYKLEFWDKFKCDDMLDVLQGVATELFDISVNMGVSRATNFLYQGLNCLNRNGSSYSDIVVGDNDIADVVGILNSNFTSKKETEYLLKVLNLLQGNFYIDIVKSDSTQERFMRGWLNRVEITKGNNSYNFFNRGT